MKYYLLFYFDSMGRHGRIFIQCRDTYTLKEMEAEAAKTVGCTSVTATNLKELSWEEYYQLSENPVK